jgi:hypothetical protein
MQPRQNVQAASTKCQRSFDKMFKPPEQSNYNAQFKTNPQKNRQSFERRFLIYCLISFPSPSKNWYSKYV